MRIEASVTGIVAGGKRLRPQGSVAVGCKRLRREGSVVAVLAVSAVDRTGSL